ncbi:hypothetical protein [Aliarcobacter cryaerophilus]|nr:hypothetical protein [Aliarcobacter cryaerophilus]
MIKFKILPIYSKYSFTHFGIVLTFISTSFPSVISQIQEVSIEELSKI